MEQPEASLSSTPNPSSTPPSQASEPSSSQPPQPPSPLLPPSSNTPSTSIANAASSIHYQNPNSKLPAQPLQQQQQQQQQHQSLSSSPQTLRPSSTLNRPWQHSHFSQFSSSSPSSPSGALSTLSSPGSSSMPAPPPVHRGGVATGVPVHHPNNSSSASQPAPFASSYGQHFGGLGRGSVNVTEMASHSNTPQVRSHIQGNQAAGMFGSIASNSQMRTGGMPVQNQPRPVQSSLRPSSTPNSQPSASQSSQGHGLLRVPSVGSPVSPSPNTPQGMQSPNQPWLSTSAQGKPPLPPPSYRQQVNSPSLPQRSHIPQPQQHSMPTVSQPQQLSSPQQLQSSQLHQSQDHFGQQFQPSRGPLALTQQQGSRVLASGIQKFSSLATPPSNIPPSAPQSRPVAAEADETCNRILSKRSIHELASQIDPSERMDPEVEDILVDLADEFVESITTFGCSLAKHRKSTTLEAKDILLHLERNWNMTLPGFGSDEIKIYKKTLTSDIHKDRLAAIKKSIASNEAANTRHSGGQATGNTKGSLAKFSANVIGSKH